MNMASFINSFGRLNIWDIVWVNNRLPLMDVMIMISDSVYLMARNPTIIPIIGPSVVFMSSMSTFVYIMAVVRVKQRKNTPILYSPMLNAAKIIPNDNDSIMDTSSLRKHISPR